MQSTRRFLSWIAQGQSLSRVEAGQLGTTSYRMQFTMDGKLISPWHDIPLLGESGVYNMVAEIPKDTVEKMEMIKEEPHNAIMQDTKKGVPRILKYSPLPWNYGMFPQTWEDPRVMFQDPADSGAAPLSGDGDPVDVVELSARAFNRGEVVPVRVLGALALIDEGELDWKLIAIDATNAEWENVRTLADVKAEQLVRVRDWYQKYKTAEGKPENKFGFAGEFQDGAYARTVLAETHHHWQQLRASSDWAHFGFWQPSS